MQGVPQDLSVRQAAFLRTQYPSDHVYLTLYQFWVRRRQGLYLTGLVGVKSQDIISWSPN